MKKIAHLYNRDHAGLWVEELEDNWYELKSDKKYVLEYACCTLSTDNQTIEAVDPSGGPYINLGYEIQGIGKVKEIVCTPSKILLRIG